MSVSVYLSASIPPKLNVRPFPISAHVAYVRGSVFLRRRCNTLSTSGFIDDVRFAHNGDILEACKSKVYVYSSSQTNLPHRYGNSHASTQLDHVIPAKPNTASVLQAVLIRSTSVTLWSTTRVCFRPTAVFAVRV